MINSVPVSNGIPSDSDFRKTRDLWRLEMGKSKELRKEAIKLAITSNHFQYGYQWEWCGIPIIRHPDDIVLQQEIMWSIKPTHVIETGVARGGSLALSSTLLGIISTSGKVLGIDIQILEHATEALKPWTSSGRIKLLECDSTSIAAQQAVQDFLKDSQGVALMVLDSNHTHDHVFNELTRLTHFLPIGSVVIVTDTIIEEMPNNYYLNRPWGRGNNPLTAVNKFLDLNLNFKIDVRWSRRSLIGEFRDGIIIRVS